MTETNCNVCLTDKTLTFVSVANTTLTPKKFKIEAVDHDKLYACLDKDPSATLEGTIFSTCLTERDPCKNPTVSANDVRLAGNWTVELEDGTLIENKTLEELSELLLDYEILLKLPTSLGLNCDQFEDLPNSFETEGNLDYQDDRQWELYVNNELYGITGGQFEYMEDLVNSHPDLTGNYGSGLIIINDSSNRISLAFVATKGNIENDESFYPKFSNESLQYDLETGIMQFCLNGMSKE